MNPSTLLSELKSALQEGRVEPEEVRHVLAQFSASEAVPDELEEIESARRLSAVLYCIGGGVVFLGLVFLLAQVWDEFSPWLRILSTLGTGLGMYASGALLSREPALGIAGTALFLISLLIMPAGLLVTFHELDLDQTPRLVNLELSALLLALYLTIYLILRQTLLLVASILFASWLFFAATDYLTAGAPVFDPFSFLNYRLLAMGLSYMALGHALRNSSATALTGWLYGFGVVAFLGAALALGKWTPEQNVTWEIVFPGLVFGVLMLSVQFKSRVYLVFASLFLGIYLTKITAVYFPDSLGWPLALVVLGFLLMVTAWLAVFLSRRYLAGRYTADAQSKVP